MANPRLPAVGVGFAVAGLILLAIGSIVGSGPGLGSGHPATPGLGSSGMMGHGANDATPAVDPGSVGFVAGTTSTPRVVRIVARGELRFLPDVVTVKQGETITFELTAMGMTSHEFMVGPAADVAADTPGTPEVADIGMMEAKSLTYTFDGSGPFTFACHAPGHYEAGMKGTIVVVP